MTEAEADAARERIEREIARLRPAMRLRDGEPAREVTRQAMSALQIPGSGDYRDGVISWDTDGDGRVDLQIGLDNEAYLRADDFLL
jgi:hypothetical protein